MCVTVRLIDSVPAYKTDVLCDSKPMSKTKPLRVALYARCSTNDEKQEVEE